MISAAFSPGGDVLACGASDGSVHLFMGTRSDAPVQAGSRREESATVRWVCEAARGAPVEHLRWAGEGVLAAASYSSERIALWDFRREKEQNDVEQEEVLLGDRKRPRGGEDDSICVTRSFT